MNTFLSKKKKNIFAIALVATLLVSAFMQIQVGFASGSVIGVNGQTLSASKAGDTSDWIEIARSGDYSLILRKENLPNSRIPFATNYVSYQSSDARGFVNNWFKNGLSSNARLRDFTVKNDALTNLGSFGSTGSGISKPSPTLARTGDDVAFLLSFAEASLYCSKQYATSTTNFVNSPGVAQSNYNKLIVPYGQQNDFWWLRSPGATGTTTSSFGSHSCVFTDTYMARLVYQSSTIGGYPFIRPALWVHSSIFSNANTDYVVQYCLAGTTQKLVSDKVVTGKPLGASVTETAITIPGYTAVAPTTLTKTLGASGNVFTFYYTADCAPVQYVVHYYLSGTTQRVAADKFGSGLLGAYVTEFAIGVSGYSVASPTSVSKVLGASDNVFVFYYTACATPVVYTVHYYLSGTTTKVTDSKYAVGFVGAAVTESAVSVSGYSAVEPTTVTKTLGASGNEFIFYYTMPNVPAIYVVHYYLEGTTTSVANDKYAVGFVGSSITESAITVSGYTALTPTSFTKVVTQIGTEFIFYYTENANFGSIPKTVNGIAFNVWAAGYSGNIAELVSGMNFKVYKITDDGNIDFNTVTANGALNPTTGRIVFDSQIPSGWYVVVETLTGKAAQVFENVVPITMFALGDGTFIGTATRTTPPPGEPVFDNQLRNC